MVKGEISLLRIIFEFSKGAVWKADFSRAQLSSLWLWHCILKHIFSDLHFLLHASHDLHPYHTHASSILSLLRLHRCSLFGLFLSSHIHPPSLIHHPFNGHSLSIPVIWDCVCKSISGDVCVCVWVQWFACVQLAMDSDSLWDLRLHIIRKNQITIITRFWLFLGKKFAHEKCTYMIMLEHCGLLPEHCFGVLSDF